MPHPAAQAIPILQAAAALGFEVTGRRAHCFNAAGHAGGVDRRPSLTFFLDSNRYQCFSCGEEGDTIDLVKAVLQFDFKSAVEWLQGLALGKAFGGAPAKPRIQRSSRTPDKQASEVYEALFTNSYAIDPTTVAGRYLSRRKLDPHLASEYDAVQIGDASELWGTLTNKFGRDRLHSAGLLSHKGNFLFHRHRLLFFYFDGDRPVYVQGRNIDNDSEPKELSLAGLRSPVPYNANLLRTPQKRIYLCEGCIDTLSAIQMDLPAIGVPGTVAFNREWFDLFKQVRHVVLVFDNDESGRRQSAELRSQFRLRGIKADAYHPKSVNDMNDLLKTLKEAEGNL